ncbi:MAG: hypothetical protein FD123_279 [Bacteroidetes bacterium]|nr:MAG: hypothetical protein FD123_279 [Bacteroidota bacterium]
MGRKISPDLFQLIQSMKQAEKRYFKIFSRRHTIGEGNNYLALFDAIGRQKTYDEKALLQENRFLRPSLFPDQKHHLYNLVLRAMATYACGKTADSELHFLLDCAEVLHKKGLYLQARKLLASAKKLALKLEKGLVYIDCLEREKKIELLLFNLKTSPAWLDAINREIERTTAQLAVDQAYGRLSEEMYFILVSETYVRSEKNTLRSKKIMSHPLMKTPPTASLRSRFNFHRTHSLYYYISADFRRYYEHCKVIADLLGQHPAVLSESPKAHIVALQNLLIAQKNLRLYDELFVTLKHLKKFESGPIDIRAQVFAIAHDIELTIYIDTGQFEKGALLAGTISRGLDQYKEYISPSHELLFYFNVAYNFIGCGNYRKALTWLNKMVNHPKAHSALPFVFHMAHLVLLIVHYELGNTDLVEYRMRTVAKTFSKKHELYDLENVLFAFLSKAVIAEPKTLGQLRKKLFRDLDNLHADPEKRGAFFTFDFLAWAESFVSGRTMSEILQNREH